MRLCRFDDNRIGVAEGDTLADVTAIAERLPLLRWPVPHGDLLISHLSELRPELESLAKRAPRLPLAGRRFLSPVANPAKIIGIGRAYKGHVEEAARDPGLHHGVKVQTAPDTIRMFIKASTALVGPSEGVALRFLERRNDPELELAVIIGRKSTGVARAQALDIVAGYAIGFDMTLRGPEPPSSRKSIDSYGVLGPWLVTADEFGNPDDVEMTLKVNGEVRQRAATRDLLFPVAAMIENAAKFYTLYPGDIIMTGTPEGVAPIQPGDVLTAEVTRIGAMTVAIRSHAS